MAKVTSKRQVTIPKRIADRYGIGPGDELDWLEADDAIRVIPRRAERPDLIDTAQRIELFDAATERQRQRQSGREAGVPGGRGWSRDDLYTRGGAD